VVLALPLEQPQGQGLGAVEGCGAVLDQARRAACSSASLSTVSSLAGGIAGCRVAPKRASTGHCQQCPGRRQRDRS
jgi:hypothetical protein